MRNHARVRLAPAFAFCCALLLLIGSVAAAQNGHDHGAGHDAATPDVLGTGTAAVYLDVRNDGNSPDRLVSGTADVARFIELHDATMTDGVMQMTPMTDGLPIEPGATVTFGPGAAHIMLVDLARDLRAGDRFEIRLVFETAGEVAIPIVVGAGPDAASTPVTVGGITIGGAWSRPAPTLSPLATPAATPEHHEH